MEVQGSEAAIDELVAFLAGRRFVQISGMDVRKLDVVEDERKFGIDWSASKINLITRNKAVYLL